MTHSPLYSLGVGLMLGGIVIVCAIGPARANSHHLDEYFEGRVEQLGAVALPPPIENSYQRIHPNGLIVNSNVRDRTGRECKSQIGMDGLTPVVFEHCQGDE